MGRVKDSSRHTDALFAFGVIGLILLLIVPVPPFLLDILLSLSLLLSVMTLLVTLYVENALEFSAFPSLLLFLTLYRLGLNIASTRMILTHAEGGRIIQTFGDFVTQNNTLVGLILFVLLTIINFIVVTKGAGRIAEVAARFTLEALPGKQMAIDAEITAGLLTKEEARKARDKVTQEADFYGAMDGASKFVRGEAIAALLIIIVNIVGGFIVGVTLKAFSWQTCWSTFTRLTVGDGLVTQIPALLVSVGAGMMVTRASSGSVSRTLGTQIFRRPKVLLIAAINLFVFSLIPGMPALVLLPISALLFIYSYIRSRKKDVTKEEIEEKPSLPFFHPIEVHLGFQAVILAEPLQEHVKALRTRFFEKMGFLLPPVKIADAVMLSSTGWEIAIRGTRTDTGKDATLSTLMFALESRVEKHAHELLNRQDVAHLILEAKKVDSAVVDELIPRKVTLGQILRILQNLLKEHVPICDFVAILELLADNISDGKTIDLDLVTEKIRSGLAGLISEHFFSNENKGHVITLDPKVEQMIGVSDGKLRPKILDQLSCELNKIVNEGIKRGVRPIIVTSHSSRLTLKRLIEKMHPELPVLSYQEVATEIEIETIGTISYEVLI